MASQAQNRAHKNIKYVGTRPKNDQDNRCRRLLSEIVRDYGCFYEICPEKLYLINLADDKRMEDFNDEQIKTYENCPFIYWLFEDYKNLFSYESFNKDFGPYNLGVTHLFCSRLKIWLDTQHLREPDKYIVIVVDNSDSKRKLNVKLLVAIAAMVLLNMTDEEVIEKLNFFMLHKNKPCESNKELVFKEKKKFSDVSGLPTAMSLFLEDCIRGFYKAFKLKWYDFYEFDHPEYLFYETVMSGDLNWIIPNKIIAFAGPSDGNGYLATIFGKQKPIFYYHYFKDHNVTTIIRLNDREYDCSGFTDFGFDHHDLIFPDGYPPSSTIAAKFIKIVDQAKGAVAVHCYAGLGRTGTLIAAYLMAKYGFTAQMAIAWTRICRPGSVVGDQQDWLFTRFDPYSLEGFLKKDKNTSNEANEVNDKFNNKNHSVIKMDVDSAEQSKTAIKTTYEMAEKTYGQARALLMAKRRQEKTLADVPKRCTRNSANISDKKASSTEGLTASAKEGKRSSIILDLGKTLPYGIKYTDQYKTIDKLGYYIIKDFKYEWMVKFPQSTSVTLKCIKPNKDAKGDDISCKDDSLPEYKYVLEKEEKVLGKNGEVSIPRLKPVVKFHFAEDYEECVSI